MSSADDAAQMWAGLVATGRAACYLCHTYLNHDDDWHLERGRPRHDDCPEE